jgi:hypothetical protein
MKFVSLLVPALGNKAVIDIPDENFDVRWFI